MAMKGGSHPPDQALPEGAKLLFSRRLKPTSIKKRLPVPTNTLPNFPPFGQSHAVELRVRFQNHMYRMECSTRTTGRYKKPVLSRGWIEFVRQNRLNVGDKVTLFKLRPDGETGGPVYLIQVERESAVLSTTVQRHDQGPAALVAQGSGDGWCTSRPHALRDDYGLANEPGEHQIILKTTHEASKLVVLGAGTPRSLRSAYEATGGSSDYDTKDKEEIKQESFGKSPPLKLFGVPMFLADEEIKQESFGKSPPLKLFGVPIFLVAEDTTSTLEFISSERAEIDQSVVEFEQLDLAWKLGI